MEQKFYKIFRKSIAARLLLLVSLLVGGGNSVVADTYTETLSFNSATIPSGWYNGGNYGANYTAFNIYDGYIETTNTYGLHSLTSERTDLSLEVGQKIVISAKIRNGYTSTYQKLRIYSYVNSYSQLVEFNNSNQFTNTEYSDLEYTITSNLASCRLQFVAQAAAIRSIEIKAASGETLTEIILDEDGTTTTDFSSLTSATSIDDVYVKYTPKNGWNTVCMPFSLKGADEESTYMSTIFGDKWEAYGFSSYTDGVISFFKRSGWLLMYANTPYLVYTTDAQSKPSDGFHFEGIEVTYSANPRYSANGVTFQGTYAPITAGNMPSGSYGITNAGQIVNAGDNSSIKGYRAYLTGLPSGAGARIMILDDDSDTPTDIGLFKMAVPEAKDVYTLSGQRVQKARKGIYVINGKKIVIK